MNILLINITLSVLFAQAYACDIKNFIPTTMYSVVKIKNDTKNKIGTPYIRYIYLRYKTKPTSINCQTLFFDSIDLLHILLTKDDIATLAKAKIDYDDSASILTAFYDGKLKLSREPITSSTKDFSVLSANVTYLTDNGQPILYSKTEPDIIKLIKSSQEKQTPLQVAFGSSILLNPNDIPRELYNGYSSLDFDFLKFGVYFNLDGEVGKNHDKEEYFMSMLRFSNQRIRSDNIKQTNLLDFKKRLYVVHNDINTNKYFIFEKNKSSAYKFKIKDTIDRMFDQNKSETSELRLITNNLLQFIGDNWKMFGIQYKYTNKTLKSEYINSDFGGVELKTYEKDDVFNANVKLELYQMSKTNGLQKYENEDGVNSKDNKDDKDDKYDKDNIKKDKNNQDDKDNKEDKDKDYKDNDDIKKGGTNYTFMALIVGGVLVVLLITTMVAIYKKDNMRLIKLNKRAIKKQIDK